MDYMHLMFFEFVWFMHFDNLNALNDDCISIRLGFRSRLHALDDGHGRVEFIV